VGPMQRLLLEELAQLPDQVGQLGARPLQLRQLAGVGLQGVESGLPLLQVLSVRILVRHGRFSFLEAGALHDAGFHCFRLLCARGTPPSSRQRPGFCILLQGLVREPVHLLSGGIGRHLQVTTSAMISPATSGCRLLFHSNAAIIDTNGICMSRSSVKSPEKKSPRWGYNAK